MRVVIIHTNSKSECEKEINEHLEHSATLEGPLIVNVVECNRTIVKSFTQVVSYKPRERFCTGPK